MPLPRIADLSDGVAHLTAGPPDKHPDWTLHATPVHSPGVRDHGPGIDDEDAERIFERFHRADDARSTSGSGLGLAIVRHVAEQHGGTVRAANAVGGGAEVAFSVG